MRPSAEWLHLLQVFVAGVTLVVLAAGSLPPWSYNRDLSQDYLSARALRDGLDVFMRTTDLSEIYFPIRATHMTHPNPHPPFVVILSVPISFLPYEIVYSAGLVVNVLLLLVVGRRLGLSVPGSLALVAWPPIWWVLLEDQFEIALLFLAMLAWRAAEGGRPWRAGLWLGLAGAVKFYPVVFLVPFIARRQFRVVLAAGMVLLGAQAASLLGLGPASLVRYYTEILPQVSARYSALAINASPYGALLRIFGGASDVEPIVEVPGLAAWLAALFSTFGLVALFRLAHQGAPLASMVTLPAAWGDQVVLALPEITRLLRLPKWRAGIVAAVAAASFAQLPMLWSVNEIVVALSGWSGDRAPPILGVFGAIQTLGFVALVVLSLRTYGAAISRQPSAMGSPPPAAADR